MPTDYGPADSQASDDGVDGPLVVNRTGPTGPTVWQAAVFDPAVANGLGANG